MILAVALLIGGVYYYVFVYHLKKTLVRKMLAGASWIMIGVADDLFGRFQPEYGEENARLLAAAAVNELFSQPPSRPLTSEEQSFINSHKDIIERELANLSHNPEMVEVITQAVRVNCFVAQDPASLIAACERLMRLGFPLGGEAPIPPTFLPLAREFYLKMKSRRPDL